jgi:RNA polymerase sigma-70 factor (ECF subfamily)
MSMTDGDAIRRVNQGDVEAFSVLLGRYHPACFRYAVRHLGCPETAEEVVQDTFLRAFRGLARYDHRDRFQSWLFSILVNRCRTAAVREGRRNSRLSHVDSADLEGRASPDRIDRRVEIDAAIGRLAEDQREAFLLKYVEGLSYEEISKITGDSVSALKMRVMRARQELQHDLGAMYGNGTT